MIRTETTRPAAPAAPRAARPSGKAASATARRPSSAAPSGGRGEAPRAVRTQIETDPRNILATAMLELEAQGRVVDAEALGEKTSLTTEEIDTHWRAARDRARLRQRATGRRAA